MSDTRLMLVAMGPWMVAFVFTCWYFGYIDSNTAISGFAVSPFPTILGFKERPLCILGPRRGR